MKLFMNNDTRLSNSPKFDTTLFSNLKFSSMMKKQVTISFPICFSSGTWPKVQGFSILKMSNSHYQICHKNRLLIVLRNHLF